MLRSDAIAAERLRVRSVVLQHPTSAAFVTYVCLGLRCVRDFVLAFPLPVPRIQEPVAFNVQRERRRRVGNGGCTYSVRGTIFVYFTSTGWAGHQHCAGVRWRPLECITIETM